MHVACMFDPKRFPNANVCGMCAERVSCVSCVDKNRAYAYIYASLSQTRCVCTQIYIKNIANTHVLCALLRYHNKRACVWLENWKDFVFFHCSSLFGFPCCLLFRLLPEQWTSSREWWQPSGTQRWMSRLQRLKLHLALTNMRRLRAKLNSCYLHAQHEHLRTQRQKGRKETSLTFAWKQTK